MRPTRHPALHLLAALALLLAACGDDDSASNAEQQAEDAISDRLGGECGFLAEFAGVMDDFDPTSAMGSGGSIDFGEFYGELADEFHEVADAAPDDIQDSFQVMADAVTSAAEQLEGVELDTSDPQNMDPEALAALESLDESFGEEFSDATQEVDDWIQENCSGLADDFDLGDSGGTGG